MQFTTLVPAFKPQYLPELLAALQNQTVRPAKVMISDDHPHQAFITELASDRLRDLAAELHVEVMVGPRTGAYDNIRQLLERYREAPGGATELFHVLMDDDIIYPLFYERHLQAHRSADVSCVVSRRWTAAESGRPLREQLGVPAAIADHGTRVLGLDADLLFLHTVGRMENWLGEFSNMTFRAALAPELADATLAGISIAGLEDIGAVLKASLHGPVGFINEHLGFFRRNAEQHSAQLMGRMMKLAYLAWIALAIAGRNLGRLAPQPCAEVVRRVCLLVLQRYSREADMAGLCALLPRLAVAAPASDEEKEFLELWRAFTRAPQKNG